MGEPTAKEVAAVNLTRVTALLGDRNVRWFLEEVVDKPLADADADSKNLSKTPEERMIAAAQWHTLNRVSTFLSEAEKTFDKALSQ